MVDRSTFISSSPPTDDRTAPAPARSDSYNNINNNCNYRAVFVSRPPLARLPIHRILSNVFVRKYYKSAGTMIIIKSLYLNGGQRVHKNILLYISHILNIHTYICTEIFEKLQLLKVENSLINSKL